VRDGDYIQMLILLKKISPKLIELLIAVIESGFIILTLAVPGTLT
jgi:hypothetical protein